METATSPIGVQVNNDLKMLMDELGCDDPLQFAIDPNDATGFPLRYRGYFFRIAPDGSPEQLVRRFEINGKPMVMTRKVSLQPHEPDLSTDCTMRERVWIERDMIEVIIRHMHPFWRRFAMRPVIILGDDVLWEGCNWALVDGVLFARRSDWAQGEKARIDDWRRLKILVHSNFHGLDPRLSGP